MISHRILIVEDEPFLAQELQIRLVGLGYTVSAIVSNGNGAIQHCTESCPDMVLMDVVLEGDMDGIEAARVIHDRFNIPVVYLTAHADDDLLARASITEHYGYILKPYNERELHAVISTALHNARIAAQLAQSRQQLLVMQCAIDSSISGIALADLAGNLVYVNGAFLQLWGYSRPDEVIGKPASGFWFSEGDALSVIDILHGEGGWIGEMKARRKDGTLCDVQISASLVRGESGEALNMMASFIDISVQKNAEYLRREMYDGLERAVTNRTAQLIVSNEALQQEVATRKQAESELQLSEERFRYGQIYANIGTWDWNVQTGYLHWSERIGPLFGYAPGALETTYENFLNAVHPDDRQSVIDAVSACVEKGVAYNIEHRIVWPDGTVRWGHESGNVIRAEDGSPLRMLGVVRDITARKKVELALLESEQRLKTAQRIGHIGHWSWEVASGKIHWSDEIYKIFGLESGVFEPTYDRFIAMLHPDDVQRIKLSEQAAFAKGGKHAIDHRIVLSDGSVRWVHEEAVAEFDHSGQPLRLMGTVQDITNRKLAEYELVMAKEKAEIASRAKSEFLSRMSHELRTPLNAILGFSQLLEMDQECPLAESHHEHMEHITKAGWHLLDLINQVLDLSEIESGHMDFSIEKIDLRALVAECIALLTPSAQSNRIHIYDEIRSMPPHYIFGDKARLFQIMENLLSNAIKYNRKNGEIRLACSDLSDGWIRISISDTGIGIPQELLGNLFKPFERLDAHKNDVDGTGVGLALVKRLVEVMDGSVGVESVPGQGSTFWFEMPGMRESDVVHVDIKPEPKPAYLVLYVEDNQANLRLVTKILHNPRKDISVITAATAEEGIDLVKQRMPDMILMDINLPGMNGLQALEYLRQDMLTRFIPIIALSADAMPEQIAKGIVAGFDRYLTKPILMQNLLALVDEFLPAFDH